MKAIRTNNGLHFYVVLSETLVATTLKPLYKTFHYNSFEYDGLKVATESVVTRKNVYIIYTFLLQHSC